MTKALRRSDGRGARTGCGRGATVDDADCCGPEQPLGCTGCCPADSDTRFPTPCTPGVPPWIEIFADRRVSFSLDVEAECNRTLGGIPINARRFQIVDATLGGTRFDRIDQAAPGMPPAAENRCAVTCERPVPASDDRYIAPDEPGYPGDPGVTMDYLAKPQEQETQTVGDVIAECWDQDYDLAYTTRMRSTKQMKVYWNSCARYHDVWGRLFSQSEGGQRMNLTIDLRFRILAGFLPPPEQGGGGGGEQLRYLPTFQVLIASDLTFEASGRSGGLGQIYGGFGRDQVTRSTFTGGCQSRGGVSLFKQFGPSNRGGFQFYNGNAKLDMQAGLAVDWNYDTAGYVHCTSGRAEPPAYSMSTGVQVRGATLDELEEITGVRLWDPAPRSPRMFSGGGCAGCGDGAATGGATIA